MKANEFVKLVGLIEAKRIIRDNEIKGRYRHLNVCHVDLVELHEIVESHELVMDYYGLTRAKEYAESNYTAPEIKDALKQAIADVESCLKVDKKLEGL
ncbi:hypothetical protein [Acinetobacter terrestris]|uniref:HEPN domain-containing protein n=1 Tax=Acinetobacter terrestris TaxID=2529843 RepID=A0ABX1UT37_9GAMM|nr:hypothetical protein [Acinetobacter terrestris]NNH25630.1 hypothetical protein [Acinetobacter terrestris]